jgi:hypothetical protein
MDGMFSMVLPAKPIRLRRKRGVIAVACTQARYVTKPRGARAGTVQIRKERIYKVRPALPDSDPE